MPYDMKRLEELHGALYMAKVALLESVIEELPAGTEVTWTHGGYPRSGTVKYHSGTRTYVTSYTGKEYWIDTWRIYHDGTAKAPCPPNTPDEKTVDPAKDTP